MNDPIQETTPEAEIPATTEATAKITAPADETREKIKAAKATLKQAKESVKAAKKEAGQMTLWQTMASGRVLMLSLIYFCFVASLYGMQFWLPQIVKAFGFSNVQTGFVTAIPYAFGSVAMILWARHSDQTRERVWHVGLPMILISVSLGAAGLLTDPTWTMVALTVAAIGVFCTFALFWTLPTSWLTGAAAAGGIAMINSIGNLAGFGGPYLIGWIKEATGSTSTGLLVLAVMPLIAGALVLFGKHDTSAEFAEK